MGALIWLAPIWLAWAQITQPISNHPKRQATFGWAELFLLSSVKWNKSWKTCSLQMRRQCELVPVVCFSLPKERRVDCEQQSFEATFFSSPDQLQGDIPLPVDVQLEESQSVGNGLCHFLDARRGNSTQSETNTNVPRSCAKNNSCLKLLIPNTQILYEDMLLLFACRLQGMCRWTHMYTCSQLSAWEHRAVNLKNVLKSVLTSPLADASSPSGWAILFIAVGEMQTGKAILCPRMVVLKSLLDTSLMYRGRNLYLQEIQGCNLLCSTNTAVLVTYEQTLQQTQRQVQHLSRGESAIWDPTKVGKTHPQSTSNDWTTYERCHASWTLLCCPSKSLGCLHHFCSSPEHFEAGFHGHTSQNLPNKLAETSLPCRQNLQRGRCLQDKDATAAIFVSDENSFSQIWTFQDLIRVIKQQGIYFERTQLMLVAQRKLPSGTHLWKRKRAKISVDVLPPVIFHWYPTMHRTTSHRKYCSACLATFLFIFLISETWTVS